MELSERLKRHEKDLSGMRTLERVRTALQWRLEMLMPVMGEFWLNHMNSPFLSLLSEILYLHVSPGSKQISQTLQSQIACWELLQTVWQIPNIDLLL